MVKKLKVKVTAEELAIAESHGIAYNTVYTRMQRGWDKHRAITESPKTSPAQTLGLERNAEGSIISDNPKGKQRSIRLPAEWDEKADQAIAQSGLTQSEWIAGVIVEHLQKKKKGN